MEKNQIITLIAIYSVAFLFVVASLIFCIIISRRLAIIKAYIHKYPFLKDPSDFNPDDNLHMVYHLLGAATNIMLTIKEQHPAINLLNYLEHHIRTNGTLPEKLHADEYGSLIAISELLADVELELKNLSSRYNNNQAYQHLNNLIAFIQIQLRNRVKTQAV